MNTFTEVKAQHEHNSYLFCLASCLTTHHTYSLNQFMHLQLYNMLAASCPSGNLQATEFIHRLELVEEVWREPRETEKSRMRSKFISSFTS